MAFPQTSLIYLYAMWSWFIIFTNTPVITYIYQALINLKITYDTERTFQSITKVKKKSTNFKPSFKVQYFGNSLPPSTFPDEPTNYIWWLLKTLGEKQLGHIYCGHNTLTSIDWCLILWVFLWCFIYLYLRQRLMEKVHVLFNE